MDDTKRTCNSYWIWASPRTSNTWAETWRSNLFCQDKQKSQTPTFVPTRGRRVLAGNIFPKLHAQILSQEPRPLLRIASCGLWCLVAFWSLGFIRSTKGAFEIWLPVILFVFSPDDFFGPEIRKLLCEVRLKTLLGPAMTHLHKIGHHPLPKPTTEFLQSNLKASLKLCNYQTEKDQSSKTNKKTKQKTTNQPNKRGNYNKVIKTELDLPSRSLATKRKQQSLKGLL